MSHRIIFSNHLTYGHLGQRFDAGGTGVGASAFVIARAEVERASRFPVEPPRLEPAVDTELPPHLLPRIEGHYKYIGREPRIGDRMSFGSKQRGMTVQFHADGWKVIGVGPAYSG